jgi:uncharacterized SAM-binding protein YcdF (DUF218 family)
MGVILRLVKWGVRLGLGVLALTIGAVMYFSDANLRAHGSGRSLDAPVDAILVLGGGIDGDGVLGFSSRRRVLAAVAALDAGQAQYIILTGGPDWREPQFTGAALMRDHALALGAPADTLIVEGLSNTTFENLRFGFALAEERDFARLALLTDAFHLERAKRMAAYFGQPDIALIAAGGLRYDGIANRVWAILREALAWWLNLAKVAGWEALAALGVTEETRQGMIW